MAIANSPAVATPRRPHHRPWQLRADQKRLAQLIPAQGEWTAADYLWLTERTNRLVELADGWIEELPMPTETHQRLSKRLLLLLDAWVGARRGIVLYAPLRVRIAERRFREPDLVALLDAADPRRGDAYWTGADLVVEIASPDNADHDRVTKRAEYAEAGIMEYWIVDPDARTLTVLALEGAAYRDHGLFGFGDMATSPLLTGLEIAVDEVFASS